VHTTELSIVIPVYQAAPQLPLLLSRLRAVLESLGREYEIICVDDGSRDESWKILRQLQAADRSHIVAIQLMRNYGQHNALMAGFRHARGRYVITMDDDLQNPPEEIPKLLKAIESNDLDLVYGTYQEKRHHRWRNLGSSLVKWFYRRIFHSPIDISPFRIIRRELLTSIFTYSLNFTFVDGLLAWNTQRVGQVTVEHHARAEGQSGYSLGKLILLALNLFTNFSLLPLQLVSGLGLLTASGGLLTAFYYFIQFERSKIEWPGYASTIIAVLTLGGIQLLALGIIGEYIGRLLLNVNRKPQYVERTVLNRSEDCPISAHVSDAAEKAQVR
jgi:undecaprenyl-phosphate 4-deoxy-4-formamido-L-arabinose transferase